MSAQPTYPPVQRSFLQSYFDGFSAVGQWTAPIAVLPVHNPSTVQAVTDEGTVIMISQRGWPCECVLCQILLSQVSAPLTGATINREDYRSIRNRFIEWSLAADVQMNFREALDAVKRHSQFCIQEEP